MNKIRIGAVNWDASLAPDTYFGFYQTRSLSKAKWREWTPFYADIIDDERITYHKRTVEEYEREMQYAIDSGVDYFAFVWYPTEGSITHEQTGFSDCSHKVHELNYARGLYKKSNLKNKLSMCAILAAHPFTDRDLFELVDEFTEPYYEKINTRPLLYVYRGYRTDIITKIHQICKERNIPTPYTVPMVDKAPEEPLPLADALSAYAVCANEVNSHDQLTDVSLKQNSDRRKEGLKLIPTFSIGWNPTPRIERKTPWTSNEDGVSFYPDVSYAPRATAKELFDGAVKFADFIKREVKDYFIGHILTFSWNEFEEGGYFCPTYTKNGEIDITRVNIFNKISELFHCELEET